jgi:hypothetical protein
MVTLELLRVDRAELEPLATQPRVLRYRRTFDGCPYSMLEGPSGDLLLHYGDRALFHLSGDQRLLRCAVTAGPERSPERVLLDTVLWTASLLQGFEMIHASAVETASGVIALAGRSGAGKTTLASELIRRGGWLFADDIVALGARDGGVLAYPGPPLMNLPLDLALEGADVLARFGDEQWVCLPSGDRRAQALAAVILIDRAPAAPAGCAAIQATGLTLLPFAVGFPHLDDRARPRFELLSGVAATARILHLTADPSLPAVALCDLVERAIGSL